LPRAKIIKDKLIENNRTFFSIFIETNNGIQMFLSEGEDRLGTLAVAVPQKNNLLGPPLSSILLGDRNMMISRLLAENLAKKMNRISLVSVFSKSINEMELGPILRKLMENTLEKENKKN
jgi:hypothetical protein